MKATIWTVREHYADFKDPATGVPFTAGMRVLQTDERGGPTTSLFRASATVTDPAQIEAFRQRPEEFDVLEEG
ncbi:MAG TPA: hypothetical protein VJN95_08755 [Gemmatimonadales bacterium]|nr:hypothetical protein [Gemmatimonadales bacterium]